jgi:hypothetical protein
VPDYRGARPFDFVKRYLALEQTVNQLAIRSPGVTGTWVDQNAAGFLHGFVLQSDGRFLYQITGNRITFDVFHLTMPATSPFVPCNIPGLLTSDKQWLIVTSNPSGTPTPRAYWSATTGDITIQNVAASAADVSWTVTLPLDV